MTDAPLSPAAEHYNITAYYRDIHRGGRRAYAGQPLRVGMPAPDFQLPTVAGGVAGAAAGEVAGTACWCTARNGPARSSSARSSPT